MDESESQHRQQQQQRPVASSDTSASPADSLNSSADLLDIDSLQLTGDNVDAAAAGEKKPCLVPAPPTALLTPAAEPVIIHAGAVISMLHLLPSIASQQQPQVTSTYFHCTFRILAAEVQDIAL